MFNMKGGGLAVTKLEKIIKNSAAAFQHFFSSLFWFWTTNSSTSFPATTGSRFQKKALIKHTVRNLSAPNCRQTGVVERSEENRARKEPKMCQKLCF